jgi:hypothetical protein
VRPERLDIALPPFPPGIEWIRGEPSGVDRISAAGPLLVHFVDVAHHSSVRTIPYLRAWDERYAPHGLTTLGVNSPRFPFTGEPEKLAAAVARLEIRFPVACDAGHAIWNDYGCKGWPSLFLWGRGGALRWFHFGEGEYEATERAIQEALAENDPSLEWPAPVRPVRASDAPGALVAPPTDEVIPKDPTAPIELDYAAGSAYAAVDGAGELRIRLDDDEQRVIEVTAPGAYELASHEKHESHHLAVEPSAGVTIWSISFGAGVPELVR